MIDLSKNGKETANSYIIQEPGNYCFPLVFGNALVNNKPNTIAYQNNFLEETQSPFYDHLDKIITRPEIPYKAYETKIIAYDSSREFIRDLRIEGDYIKFQVIYVPDSGANYVIAALELCEKIIWSWHIWLWKDELEDVELDNGLFILNTNLGSKKYGRIIRSCLYQWGRKDPFWSLNNKIRAKFSSSSAETVGESIQNPDILYNQTITYNDNWVNLYHYYNYWNAMCYELGKTERVEKTIYDPCLPGYHVPQRDILNIQIYKTTDGTGTIQLSNGNTIKPTGYIIPAAREYLELTACCYWTAANYHQKRLASRFYFNSSGILDAYDGCSRSFALPIRPQKAL